MTLIAFLLVPILVLAALERWPLARRADLPLLRDGFAGDVVLLLVGFVATAPGSVRYVAWASSALHGAAGWLGTWSPFWLVPAALVLLDLGNYACHLLLHRVDALWEFHKVHHSSRELDWLATFRSHLVEQLLRRLVAPLLLILAGFPVGVVALAGGILTAWAILNHANLRLRLGFLRHIVITPAVHRIHHVASRSEYNLGTVLTLWDRLRGTLYLGEAEGPLGVPGEVSTYPQGFIALLREPFRRLMGMNGRILSPR